MDAQREGTHSPQGQVNGRYSPQPAGLGLDQNATQNFQNQYDQNISPTSTEQYSYGNPTYLGQMPNQFQPGSMGDFQPQNLGYKRSSLSAQRAPELSVPGQNGQFCDYNPDYPTSTDGGFMLDPSLQNAGQPQESINPADIMGNLSPSSNSGHTPPNMMGNPSPQQSPSLAQGQFHSSPRHSRNTSLDPASAQFPQGQSGDWSNMSQFRHHRAPSEVSDASVSHSPYMKQEGFEAIDHGHSPMLNPQADSSVYPDSLRMEQFSISDAQHQQGAPGQHISPRHSPYPSPRMSPHTGLNVPDQSQFVLPSNDMGGQFGPIVYSNEHPNMGQGGQIAPPEINVVYAPPSRPNESARGEGDLDGLSPPERGEFAGCQ